MGIGFAPTWLRQVSPPLLHKTTLTTGRRGPAPWDVDVADLWEICSSPTCYHTEFGGFRSIRMGVGGGQSILFAPKFTYNTNTNSHVVSRTARLKSPLTAALNNILTCTFTIITITETSKNDKTLTNDTLHGKTCALWQQPLWDVL